MKPAYSMVTVAEEYIETRRRLGYALHMRSAAGELLRFARYADQAGHRGPLTTELAARWAKLPATADPSYWVYRLGILRRFAQYRAAFDPATEIPPADLLGPHYRRKPPHIYSDKEIAELLQAASELGPPGGLRPHTYATLLGLLVSTGLRISEAIRLTRQDVDLNEGVLIIRATKFKKSRLVPIHASTVTALNAYAQRRNRRYPHLASDRFFLSERTRPLAYSRVQLLFGILRRRLGWVGTKEDRLPRIHDLRHTFAVRRLIRWYQEGADIDRKISALATYLGHVKVTDTYWYLTAVPELLAIVGTRFEHYANVARK